MQYHNIKPARFMQRPNRFIAYIDIDGKQEICHVKNTGRCQELLLKGATVYVQPSDNTKRKTHYDLIAVQKGERIINIDSQAPNKVFAEWLMAEAVLGDIKLLKPESVYGSSRFDFYLETSKKKIFIEVKGVTLEENGVALFPDAPTQRGLKHINELVKALQDGYEAYLVFMIQMKNIRYFTPNYRTHQAFGDALTDAIQQGVKVIALDCEVTADTITASEYVKVRCYNNCN